MKNCIFSILLILFCTNSKTQITVLKFKHYSIEEGIADRSINDIFQDKEGYIWISTPKGLDRYDGERFVNIPDNFQDVFKNGIADVSCVNQYNNILWIATKQGLLSYNIINHSYNIYLPDSINNSLSNVAVYDILIDSISGVLWLGTWDGLDRFDLKTKSFKHFAPDNQYRYAYNVVVKIADDSKGNLWIATRDGGLSSFDKDKETFVNYRHNANDKNSISNNWIRDVVVDNQGNILVATWGGGLNRIDTKT